MLTPSKPLRSRSHHSAGRTFFITLLALAVVATLLGVGYLVTRSGGPARHAAATAPATSAATRTTAAPPPSTAATPAPSQLAAGVVPFVALPVGTPPTPGESEARYPWHRLKASLEGPRTVSSGSTVDYSVVLRNPTAAAIALEPCPSYDIDIGLHTSSYGLNCAAAPNASVGPGASVSFEVQVYVPSSIGAGNETVTWTLGWQSDRGSPHAQLKVDVQ